MTRETLVARGLHLEYLTVGWNVLEGALAIVFGCSSGSIALLGFGLDSVIEVSSGMALVWRLHADQNTGTRERAERLALRLVGVSFLLLSAYILFDSGKALLQREAPERSVPGIALAFASLLVMPLLARTKGRVAAALGSGALQADSQQTDICAWLSGILIGGLALNAWLGWWWADPAAGAIMVPFIAKEGVEAVRGKNCCHHVAEEMR